jgi:hypothetical protein
MIVIGVVGVGVAVMVAGFVLVLARAAKLGDERMRAQDDMSFPELDAYLAGNIEDNPADARLGRGRN